MSKRLPVPRPEYPRPQFVRSEWLNLNGKWDFELDPGISGVERGLHLGKRLARKIVVPFCPESRLSGLGIKDFMPCVWYRRTFELPRRWEGKRVLLHFGAVDYEATVWVNGQQVGSHRGGYSPFSFEITRFVGRGANTVVVRAVDDTRSPLQPSGKQARRFDSYGCCYTRTTGIWQTVWLEAVPATYVQSARYYPNIDAGTLTVQTRIGGDAKGCTLRAEAYLGGKKVGSAEGAASGTPTLTLKLAELRLWEPGKPQLYDLVLSLSRGRERLDVVRSYFGMRKVHIDGLKVRINNRSVFQRLVLDQGFYPDGIYTAPADSELRNDVKRAMAMGFNGARLHMKVFEPRFLYWADRLGYLCWGEFPNWGLDHKHPLALERMLPEWLEVVERDFNHPAIIGWCPFNETPGDQNPELLRTIYRVTKSVDWTRPVIDTSGYVHVETDIYDCHNYEQDPAKLAAAFEQFKTSDKVWHNSDRDAAYRGQPYFVSEYGGIWWNPGQKDQKAWGYGARPETEEEFLTRYRALTETLLFHPKMFAFCYTQLYDIEQEVNGLYTYDRRPKFAPRLIRRINTQKAAIEE